MMKLWPISFWTKKATLTTKKNICSESGRRTTEMQNCYIIYDVVFIAFKSERELNVEVRSV